MKPNHKTSSKRNPVSDLTNKEISALAGEMHRRCRHWLRHFPAIEAEDVAQEAMITILRRDFGGEYDPERASFTVYAIAVGWWKCRSAIRSHYVRHNREEAMNPFLEDTLVSTANDPQRMAAASELGRFLKALQDEDSGLTELDRAALERMIAKSQGMRRPWNEKSTVRVQETRCRERLRQLLEGFLI